MKCSDCKKDCTKRVLDANTKLCPECLQKHNQLNANVVEFGDDDSLGDIKFTDFKSWLTRELHVFYKNVVQEEVDKRIKPLNDELTKLRKELTKTRESLNTSENAVTVLKDNVKTIKEKLDGVQNISNNHLKYLINHDRDKRKYGFLIMGLDEQTALNINDNLAVSDDEKVGLISHYLLPEKSINVKDMFRLGIAGENIRPLKVLLEDKESVFALLKASKNLKDLKTTIYIKPDRTKSERAESDRLYKKFKKAGEDYPSDNPDQPRVTLAKGVLTVDGTEIDRYKSPQSLF